MNQTDLLAKPKRGRATKLPCPRCKTSPHRREKLREKYPSGIDFGNRFSGHYFCNECGGSYPDWTEREAQAAILQALRRHPKVARCVIDNATEDRGKRSGRKNNSDIRGHMKNGIALYVEVKAHASYTNAEQIERTKRQEQRLAEARACGCIAFVAWGPWDVEMELGK